MQQAMTLELPGFAFEDLFSPEGLARLYNVFLQSFSEQHPTLFLQYKRYANQETRALFSEKEKSDLLCHVAPIVSSFVVQLFGKEVQSQVEKIKRDTESSQVIFQFKHEFVKRRVLKRIMPVHPDELLSLQEAFLQSIGIPSFKHEMSVAQATMALLKQEQLLLQKASLSDEEKRAKEQISGTLETLADLLLIHKEELEQTHHFLSFHFPHTTNEEQLIPLRKTTQYGLPVLRSIHHRPRDGFHLTDPRMSSQEVLAEVDYCLYCHSREKDSCRKGLTDKHEQIKQNSLGIDLHGCPLDEKISESNLLRKQGDPIAALALICIDNPMCAGTGHRVCNDCMKACIYQKQTPVNIPQIETGILTDVLALPFGTEIYGLLTRFNPLHVERPFPLPYRGKNILVVGLGPAGYTLCHYLSQEGFGVVGIDGLALEPPPKQAGDRKRKEPATPVRRYEDLTCDLAHRAVLGFGGVSEYGITSRWDKNFLSLLYLTLARKPNLSFYGNIRFGGTLTLEDAFDFGFDHVALAAGAGKPTLLSIENNLSLGTRQASDFLMSLQLQKAHASHSLAQVQVQLPALVIGGGLTAIDTATELLAYYVVQAEKTLSRWHDLTKFDPSQEAALLAQFTPSEQAYIQEQLSHGRLFKQERQQAAAAHRPPSFGHLLDQFGGVTLVYRKQITDSPAYRYNHEELEKGLEEGVRYMEGLVPQKALLDQNGRLHALECSYHSVDAQGVRHDRTVQLPAKTLLIAAGTKPNTMYEREYPGHFHIGKDGYFTPHHAKKAADESIELTQDRRGVFSSYQHKGRTVSFYGDNHASYSGSVVKAMASAKHGYAQVSALFDPPTPAPFTQFESLCDQLDRHVLATVFSVKRLSDTIVELTVHAPLATKKFQPGQFYRVQNTQASAIQKNGQSLSMEGLALTGASVDIENGLLTLIVLEMGASSRLCHLLSPGDPIAVMGPTGAPTFIPKNKRVCLVGGGLGNAVLFSIAQALKTNGCEVLYFAGYRRAQDVVYQETIEAYADQVIFCCDSSTSEHRQIPIHRDVDRVFTGNLVQAMLAYATKTIGGERFDLNHMDHLIVIGSDRMMAAIKQAQHTVLRPYLHPQLTSVASVNSPMQCMMKEICAQCIQRQIDPHTGQERFVFSCVNQDQPLGDVDFEYLSARLNQNSAQEKLTSIWLEWMLRKKA